MDQTEPYFLTWSHAKSDLCRKYAELGNCPVLLPDIQKHCYPPDSAVLLQVPAHLQNSWESYYMEILMVTGLLAYIMNYIIGKNKNSRLAQAWFSSHRELLESNFALVGESFQLRLLNRLQNVSEKPVTLQNTKRPYMIDECWHV